MNKTITLIYIMLTAFIFTAYCNESKAKQMKIGYTQGDFCLSLGTERRLVIKGAIQFPGSYMARLKGSKIVKVRIGIGDSLTEQENSIFITNKLDGEPLYTQTVERFNAGWNEIDLKSPLEITGEELFIGYQYVTRGMTISFDAGENNPLADWISVGTTEKDMSWNHQENCGSLNIQAIIEGDNLPQNDAMIYSVTSKKYAQTAQQYPVNILVRNMAAPDIQSLDFTYTLERQEPVTGTVDNLCIKSNDIALVHVDDAFIGEDGIYNMNIKIDRVNGENDESVSDNELSIENIVCKKDYTKRKVLLEQFSTAKCNNCPAAHKLFEKNLKYRNEDVIWLTHHSGFYTDDLTIDESKRYIYFYNSPSTYAPAAMLDRMNLAQYGAVDQEYKSTLGPVFKTSFELIPKLLNQRSNNPSLITVNIDKAFNAGNRLLTVSVSGEIPSGDPEKLKGNDIRLNVYLVEDSIPGIQSGIEGTYLHNHVIRKVLTDVWGDKITFNSGKYLSNEYSFTIPAEWNVKNTRIIAFVANSDSSNPNNAQIFNAEEVDLMKDSGDAAIQSEKGDNSIEIYQNDENLLIKGKYRSAVFYNISGNIVETIYQPANILSIATWEKGIYLIKFNLNNTSVIRKFLKH